MSSNRVVSEEEELRWYDLIEKAVKYYRKSFYFLFEEETVEDLVDEFFIKFKKGRIFEKYNESITSKQYLIFVVVRRALVDKARQLKGEDNLSLDEVLNDTDGLTVEGCIEDSSEEVEDKIILKDFIESIPTPSWAKEEFTSPVLGRCRLTVQVFLMHKVWGYSNEELVRMGLSRKVINRIVKYIKDVYKKEYLGEGLEFGYQGV